MHIPPHYSRQPSSTVSVFLQCVVIFRRSLSKVEVMKTIFVRTCVEKYCILLSNFEMNVCFEQLGGMCGLFYENRMGIKKKCDKFVYLFCLNTCTKFC